MSHPAQQQAVISLMGEQYQRIRAIEAEWSIRFREEDLRPRIDHFHDCVRALSSGDPPAYARGGRLTVEYLAYDLAELRRIPAKPVGVINRTTEKSPTGALVVAGTSSQSRRTPDQKTRSELASLYTQYTVLFSALFAVPADDDFRARSEQAEAQGEDLAAVKAVLEKLLKGTITARDAEAALMHVERDDLRDRMLDLLARGKPQPSDTMRALTQISTISQGLRDDKKRVEAAHLSYATGQLAVYEESRDLVKKMAANGLNLAGKFLEQATRNASMGRGR
jgi:hypothetical protein